MSAKHRLRVALNDFTDHSKEQKSAYFVMDEAVNDLEKLYEDLGAWGDTHEHTPKAPKEVQSLATVTVPAALSYRIRLS